MPKINFQFKQKVYEYVQGTIDVEQDIIDQGEEAIIQYIHDCPEEVEHGGVEDSYIEETHMEITKIRKA